MTPDAERDTRTCGYVTLVTGLLFAEQAVERIFFHRPPCLRWLTAAAALIGLVSGTWMIVKRRALLAPIDDWAKLRWGSVGAWVINLAVPAIAIASVWLLNRLG